MVSLLNNLAPQFSDTKEYKFGERFVFKGKLYQVMQSFSGEFDHTKTTEISIADMMKGCLPDETNGEAIGENIDYIAGPIDSSKTYEDGDIVMKEDGLIYKLVDGNWERTYLSENSINSNLGQELQMISISDYRDNITYGQNRTLFTSDKDYSVIMIFISSAQERSAGNIVFDNADYSKIQRSATDNDTTHLSGSAIYKNVKAGQKITGKAFYVGTIHVYGIE